MTTDEAKVPPRLTDSSFAVSRETGDIRITLKLDDGTEPQFLLTPDAAAQLIARTIETVRQSGLKRQESGPPKTMPITVDQLSAEIGHHEGESTLWFRVGALHLAIVVDDRSLDGLCEWREVVKSGATPPPTKH